MVDADDPHGPHHRPWAVARVFYPANDYRHPPAGLVQLRVVRRGSSYAHIDLGVGMRRVFTRPGDLLLSLPDKSTTFVLDDGRELTLLQVRPSLALRLIQQSGGRELDDLLPLLRRPVRDPLVGEIVRHLETEIDDTATVQQWALGVVFATLLRKARTLAAATTPPPLSEQRLNALLDSVRQHLTNPWTVEQMAAEVGLPRRTFAEAFKQATGISVHQYLVQLRADHAVNLLQHSQIPLADVAHQAGFTHQAHMTRVLNRLKLATPQQLRRGQSPL